MDNTLLLSIKRTKLASIRTLLSYVRTAIVLLSLAAAFVKIGNAEVHDPLIIATIALAVILLVIGGIAHGQCLAYLRGITQTQTTSSGQ